jgi:hypothetical protein
MDEQPSHDEVVANLVGYFSERLLRVFSYFYCVVEFETDDDFTADASNNGRAWALQTIREACLHTTLLALRDLEDVLTPRTPKSKPDDFKISDLGFPTSLSFLAKSEREAINKRIAHSTLPGATPGSIRWDVFELVTKGVQQSLTFLEWASNQRGTDQFQTWTGALMCHAMNKKIYDHFASTTNERRAKHHSA